MSEILGDIKRDGDKIIIDIKRSIGGILHSFELSPRLSSEILQELKNEANKISVGEARQNIKRELLEKLK